MVSDTDTEEVLTQEEIDALLTSVDEDGTAFPGSGGAETIIPGLGAVRTFDFSRQSQSLSAGLPLLNVIHERFALQLCESVFNALRCSNTVKFSGARSTSFIDYLNTLDLPSHISFITMKPMAGLALAVLDNNLITNALSSFFGGEMKQDTPINKKNFTPAEMRIGNMLLKNIISDLQSTWKTDIEISPEIRQTETNPDFAQLMNPSEQLLVNRFELIFEGTQGVFELAMPMAMIEPYRDQLSVTYQSQARESQGTWAPVIIDELKNTFTSLSSILGTAQLSLNDILNLAAGDVIPLDVKETVTLYAEGIPVFDGEYGVHNDKNAIKIIRKKNRP